jgi:16S rRNA (cytosine967-C5)-methyltransferase
MMNNKQVTGDRIIRTQCDSLSKMLNKLVPIILEKGKPADDCLSRHFKQHREFGSRDRRFLSTAFFAYFRWYGWSKKLKLDIPEACLLGMMLEMKQKDIHSAVRMLGENLRGNRPELNEGSLTERAEILSKWFGIEVVPADLMPSWIPATLGAEVDLSAFIDSCQQRPLTWLRIRTGKEETVRAAFADAGWEFAPSAGMPLAVSIEGGTALNPLMTTAGQTYDVQDISSQCVGLLCAPKAGESWWDACAGAGGKSLHLADLVGPDGSVLSTDVRAEALQELKKRARKFGIRTIKPQTMNADEESVYSDLYDGVLVDAPCAGIGTWNRNPDLRWRTFKNSPTHKAETQLKILSASSKSVAAGGKLVYAVCSLTKVETTDVVDAFLAANPEFALEPSVHPVTGAETDGRVWCLPWEVNGGGMFVAVMRRV